MNTLYNFTLLGIFIAAVGVAVPLLFVSAPYGRYARKGWGPSVSARAAWVIMELPAVVVIGGIGVISWIRAADASPLTVPLILLALWQTHYLYRTFLFPFLMRGGDKRFPVLLVLFAMIFNSANGFVNGYALFLSSRVFALAWLVDPRFIIGVVAFGFGLATHIQTDTSLRRLRRNGEGYQIPRGGMFELVSAPNYLGEIIQWCGWALLTWSLAGVSFAVFTTANLLPRALSHHAWYRSHFSDYPEKRKAVIPFLL